MAGINFIHESRSEADKNLFFGPIEPDDEFVVFDDSWTLADIHVRARLAPSRTQARKQGMDGEISAGFSVGREKTKSPHKNFWVLGRR